MAVCTQNIEKRWIAEEKDKAEQRKMQELQKQLKEERQVMELKQLQQDAGLGKASAARVDWMYEGPAAAAQPSAEEYLLGKEYKETGAAANNDVKELAEAAASKPGSLWLSKTTAANESFRRRTEDPLVAIKLREKAARERILANPMRMQAIRQAVRAALRVRRLHARRWLTPRGIAQARAKQMSKRKAAKKAKKAAKKEKKRMKKEMKAAKRATRAQEGGTDARSTDRRRSRRSRSSSSSSDDDAPRTGRATKASAPAPAPTPAPAPSAAAPRASTRWGNALPSSGATGDVASSGVRDKGRDGSGGNRDGRGSSRDRQGRTERRSSHSRRDDSRGRGRRSRSPRHGQRRGRSRSRSPHGGRPAPSSRGGRDASRSRRRGGSRSRSRSRSPGRRRRDDGRGRGSHSHSHSHSHSRRPRSRSKSRSRSPVRRRRIGDPSPERAPEGSAVDKRPAASQAPAAAPPVFDKRKYGLQRGKLPSGGTGPRRLGPSEEMLAKRMKFKGAYGVRGGVARAPPQAHDSDLELCGQRSKRRSRPAPPRLFCKRRHGARRSPQRSGSASYWKCKPLRMPTTPASLRTREWRRRWTRKTTTTRGRAMWHPTSSSMSPACVAVRVSSLVCLRPYLNAWCV